MDLRSVTECGVLNKVLGGKELSEANGQKKPEGVSPSDNVVPRIVESAS